jgi:hypothetical protein
VPFLILPPTMMISENPEIAVNIKQSARDYQDKLLSQLSILQSQLVQEIKQGAYRGTRIYSWNKKFDAYLPTYFVFQVGQVQSQEYLKASSLIRYQDCLQLGSVWNFTQNVAPFSLPDSQNSLENIANRTFLNLSPVKVNSFYDFHSENRMSHIFDLFVGEKFAEKGILNVTNLSRVVCKGNYLSELKSPPQATFPGRPHRLVIVQIASQLPQKKSNWPIVTYKSQINSGVFAEKNKEIINVNVPTPFHPQTLAEQLVNKVFPELHDLKKEEFKVIRRFRGWVYLDRGRAYGLEIGMRLIGPNDARIHVIRYLPEVQGEIDSSIAFIRYEDEKRPIVVGDVLKLDPTTFPKKVTPSASQVNQSNK